MCQLEKEMKRPLVLRHGRELPAAPQAGAAAAGADGAARQGLVAVRLQLGQRARARTPSTSWSAWASPGCGWASRAERASTRKLNGIDTRALVRELQSHGIRVLGSTIIGLRGPHAGEHRRGHRLRRRARHRLPPVHALHADPGHAAVGGARAGRHAADESECPSRRHPRPAPLQLPPPAHPRRAGDGVPPAGLPARLRGQRAEHRRACCGRSWRAASDTATTRTRGSGAASGGRRGTCAPRTPASSGPRERWFRHEPGRRGADPRGARRSAARVRVAGAAVGRARGPGRAARPSGARSGAWTAAGPTSPPTFYETNEAVGEGRGGRGGPTRPGPLGRAPDRPRSEVRSA